jgi:uncharacterized protein with HEPN domain
MKDNRDKLHLERIREAIIHVEHHLSGFKFDRFEHERTTYDAVLMQLVNIGEMVSRFSDDFRERHKDFPWHDIIGMRNQIAHGYFEIDVKEVWKTAKNDLPELKKKIEEILNNS